MASAGKLNAAQQLQEMTVFLDPRNSKAVREFYDKMLDTVQTFVKWKRDAARITVNNSEIGEYLIRSFDGLKQDSPEYTEEEVYEDFISTKTIDEIKTLESEIAQFKVLDAVKLAQDAAQDFKRWERCANDATTLGTTVTSCVGVWGVLTGLAVSNPVGATVVGVSALSAVTFQFLLGSNRSARNKKCKLNLADKALLLSDICESIRRDVLLLDEIGGHASKIAICQERIKKHGRINNLQRDKIIISAKKMKEACDRYMKREIKGE